MNYDVDMPRYRRCAPHPCGLLIITCTQTDVKRASGGSKPKRPAESYFTARYLLNFITCPATFVRCSVCITYLFNSVSKTGDRDER